MQSATQVKRIVIGLGLVASYALSIVPSADAHFFHATTMSKLTAKALQTQKFHTAAGDVECTALHLTGGEVSGSLLTLTQEVTVQYTGCKAFGLAATMTPALYSFNADNLMVFLNTVTITTEGCTITISSSKNRDLTSLAYFSIKGGNGTGITIEPSVKNITSSGTGAACTYAEESLGTYTGISDVSLEGGALSWS